MLLHALLVALLLTSTASGYLANTHNAVTGLLKQRDPDRVMRNQYNPRTRTTKRKNRAALPRRSQIYCTDQQYKNKAGDCVDLCKELSAKFYQQSESGGCDCATDFVKGTGHACVRACPASALANGFVQNPDGKCLCEGFETETSCLEKCSPQKLALGYKQDTGNGNCSCDGEEVLGSCKPACTKDEDRIGLVCAQKCKSNFVRSGLDCLCQADKFDLLDDTCKEKCSGTEERVDGACVKTCGSNSSRVNKVCKCNDNYDDVSGVCLPRCTDNLTRSGTQCVCDTTVNEVVSGQCVVKCLATQKRNASGVCELNCTGNTELVKGECKTKCTGTNIVRDLLSGDCLCDPTLFDLVTKPFSVAACEAKCVNGFLRGSTGNCDLCSAGNVITGTGTNRKCVAECTYRDCGYFYCSSTAQNGNGGCNCPSDTVANGNTCRDKCTKGGNFIQNPSLTGPACIKPSA